jgi:hypothetical protein
MTPDQGTERDQKGNRKGYAEGIRRSSMDKLINLFNQYLDRVMDWYQALTFLEQMGVLFGFFIAVFGIVALYIIRK